MLDAPRRRLRCSPCAVCVGVARLLRACVERASARAARVAERVRPSHRPSHRLPAMPEGTVPPLRPSLRYRDDTRGTRGKSIKQLPKAPKKSARRCGARRSSYRGFPRLTKPRADRLDRSRSRTGLPSRAVPGSRLLAVPCLAARRRLRAGRAFDRRLHRRRCSAMTVRRA